MSFWAKTNWAEEVEKDNGGTFEVLPEGTYSAVISNCEMKDTKSGGQRISVKLEITGPTHQGRVLFENLNVFNSNDDAVRIAVGTIHRICTAVSNEEYYEKLKTCDSPAKAEKHFATIWEAIGNRPLQIKVAIKNDEKYGQQNTIKRWDKPSGAPVAAAAPSALKKPF